MMKKVLPISRILGIDPGSHVTGYGLLEMAAGRWTMADCGIIAPSSRLSESQRLVFIFDEVQKLIGRFLPQVCAIEDVFYAKNLKSTLKLGQARGAAIVASAQLGIDVVSYLPTEIKKTVSGYGQASKDQIQTMIRHLLKLPEVPTTDASDALAVALCHAHSMKLKQIARQA